MHVRSNSDNGSFSFVNHVHPSWQMENSNCLSLKNLRSAPEKMEALAGFLSGLAFLENFTDVCFGTEAFVLGEDRLPRFRVDRFHEDNSSPEDRLKDFLLSFLFPGRNPLRGKAPKELASTVQWIRKDFCAEGLSFRPLLSGFLEAAGNDGFQIKLPPLWGTGVVWEPPDKPSGSRISSFSPGNIFHRLAMRNWSAVNSMKFISLESDLPYPYSSLEPLAKMFFPAGEGGASLWLKEFVPKGREKIARELRKLLLREDGVVLWAREIDAESRKVIDEIEKGEHPPMAVCFDKNEKAPGTVRETRLLWLPREGEDWYKQNAGAMGFGSEEEIVELMAAEEPKSFSPASPLFPNRPARMDLHGKKGPAAWSPAASWASAFEEDSEAEALKLKARALIESGQVQLGLDLLSRLPAEEKKKPEARFLHALAASRLGDHGAVLKEAAKTGVSCKGGDGLSFELLKAQALWLSGKIAEGRDLLLGLLKDEHLPRNRFRVLCQLSMLCLNSNDAVKAEEYHREAKGLLLDFDPGPMENFLLCHHSGTIERVKDRLSNALKDFSEASDWARRGGFHHLEAWSYVESGNILKLTGKFDEALSLFEKAMSGAKALRLDNLGETAVFDAIVTEIEAGKLLKAEEGIRGLMENRKVKAPLLEQAVEHYWLARILHIRGQLVPAIEEIDRGLSVMSSAGSSEMRTALLILKGNILHSLNDYRSLAHVLNKLSEEGPVFSEEPDLALEYAALLLLARSLKVDKISSASLAACEKLFPKASPVAMSSYMLAKARTSKKEEAGECALKALELGRKMNSIQVKTDALAVLQNLGQVPSLSEAELSAIETYIRENKFTGAVSGLLSLVDKKRPADKKSDAGALDFLLKSKEKGYTETARELLEITGAEALILLSPPSPLLEWGICGEYVRGEIMASAGTEFERPFGKSHVLGCKGAGGSWGALVSSAPVENEKADIFRVWLSLPRPQARTGGAEEASDLSFSEIDNILIGSSTEMIKLKRKVVESAPFNFPVLLTGEPGTGKEVCARALHFMSSRSRKNWTAFNCANLTATLAASQLFGHKKGSFTGADSDKEGLVEAAKDSTLFLDEIGELPIETQAQFLRFLQDGSYQPLGSNVTRNSDARIVAATNRKLEEEIRKGSFREDLYYRLKVISIEVPPLKDRKEDIVPLFEHFLELESKKEKIRKPEVEKGVHLKLLSHSWPGNVRELQNFVRRLLVASHKRGIIEEAMVEFEKGRASHSSPISLKNKLLSAEKDLVLGLLKKHDFNFASAAKEAGLSRQAMYQKAKKLGLLKGR